MLDTGQSIVWRPRSLFVAGSIMQTPPSAARIVKQGEPTASKFESQGYGAAGALERRRTSRSVEEHSAFHLHPGSAYLGGLFRSLVLKFVLLHLCRVADAGEQVNCHQFLFLAALPLAVPLEASFLRTILGIEVHMLGQSRSYSSCRPFKQCRSQMPQTM